MAGTRIRGVIAAIVTPVTAAGDPDPEAFGHHAEALYAEGCDGLNVLGTTGEATSFSVDQRLGLMRAARARFPEAPMMVGTGAAATADAARLTREAGALGFDAALLLPPFYYKTVSDDGLLRYFDEVAEASAGSGIPLYLYNFPALSGLRYSPELADRLIAAFGPRIAGLKDSSGDMDYAREMARRPGFDVFPSNEACLIEARGGAFAGCISATANLNARFCAAAFRAGDAAALARAGEIRALFAGRELVSAVKATVAELRGNPAIARTRPPLSDLDDTERAALWKSYRDLAEAPSPAR